MAGDEIEELVKYLARLPGLGPRSARRAVLTLMRRREALLDPLTAATFSKRWLITSNVAPACRSNDPDPSSANLQCCFEFLRCKNDFVYCLHFFKCY